MRIEHITIQNFNISKASNAIPRFLDVKNYDHENISHIILLKLIPEFINHLLAYLNKSVHSSPHSSVHECFRTLHTKQQLWVRFEVLPRDDQTTEGRILGTISKNLRLHLINDASQE